MGCSLGDIECADDEKPTHEVTITKGLWIGQTPATIGAWKRYIQESGDRKLRQSYKEWQKLNAGVDDSLPKTVSWNEASSICKWVGGRLPTEAEWEYAARAGSTAPRYGSLDAIAWYGDNSGSKRVDTSALVRDLGEYARTMTENGNGPRPVGQKLPNAWHLYDVLGNVKQWVADWYGVNYYSSSAELDPLGPPGGQSEPKVLRGSSFSNGAGAVRVSIRDRFPPDSTFLFTGFRCIWQ